MSTEKLAEKDRKVKASSTDMLLQAVELGDHITSGAATELLLSSPSIMMRVVLRAACNDGSRSAGFAVNFVMKHRELVSQNLQQTAETINSSHLEHRSETSAPRKGSGGTSGCDDLELGSREAGAHFKDYADDGGEEDNEEDIEYWRLHQKRLQTRITLKAREKKWVKTRSQQSRALWKKTIATRKL